MPTIRRCCILGCQSNSKDNIDLQFFQFPRRESPLYQLWAEACHISMRRILPLKKPILCSLHFDRTMIGGRRLTTNAVPNLRLSAPEQLVAEEEACMMNELERARKASYIEACVYESLLRMNASGKINSITFQMIKDEAQIAKALIKADDFIVDSKWLHRFRETHLIDFVRKVRETGIIPCGTSLRMEDIIQDMEYMFPPTSSTQGYANIPTAYCDYSYTNTGDYNGYDNNYEPPDVVEDTQKQFVADSHSILHDDSMGVISFGSTDLTKNTSMTKSKIDNGRISVSSSSRSYSEYSSLDKSAGSYNHHNKLKQPIHMLTLHTYLDALNYLKPLEDFALEKENYRAIGLLSQLEMTLKKYQANASS